MNINEGMSVWLKSGGPEMTIKTQLPDNSWICNWCIGEEVQTFAFNEMELTDTDPDTLRDTK